MGGLLSFAFFRIQDAVQGLRSSEEDEIGGLDIPEVGTLAYPDFLEAQGPVFTRTNGSGASAIREEVGA